MCVWLLNGKCKGEVYTVKMFDGQIKLSVCEEHLRQHLEVMLAHTFAVNVDGILSLTKEARKLLLWRHLALKTAPRKLKT